MNHFSFQLQRSCIEGLDEGCHHAHTVLSLIRQGLVVRSRPSLLTLITVVVFSQLLMMLLGGTVDTLGVSTLVGLFTNAVCVPTTAVADNSELAMNAVAHD